MELIEQVAPAVEPGTAPQWRHVAAAQCALLGADVTLATRGFGGLCRAVSRCPVRGRAAGRLPDSERDRQCGALSAALEAASRGYFRDTYCLHRSAALVCLLRLLARLPAQMVVGVRRLPFGAHAWVEIDGRAVYDLAAQRHQYREVARF